MLINEGQEYSLKFFQCLWAFPVSNIFLKNYINKILKTEKAFHKVKQVCNNCFCSMKRRLSTIEIQVKEAWKVGNLTILKEMFKKSSIASSF